MKIRIVFLSILVPMLLSCRKDMGEPPVLQVLSPSDYSNSCVADTIIVSGNVQSQSAISYIKIVLINSTFSQMCPAVTIYPQTENYNFSSEYIFSNQNLESGNYFLLVEAVNEYGSSKTYLHISIFGIPKESRSLMAFCFEKSNGHTNIYKVDSLLQYAPFKQIPGDFAEGTVSSADQLVFSMGRYSGNLYFIDASDATIVLQINAIENPPFPYFESITYSNGRLVVAYYDGRIDGYSGNGSFKYSYSIDNFKAKRVRFDGTYLMAVLEYYVGGDMSVGVLWDMSGYVKEIIFTEYTVLDLYRISGNDVVLFSNLNNQPTAKTLDTYYMTITQRKNFPSGSILGVAQVNNDRYLISHSEGILVYDYDSNTSGEIGNAAFAGKIVYDETDDIIYLASGRNINAYSYPAGAWLGTLALPDSVCDIQILYNR